MNAHAAGAGAGSSRAHEVLTDRIEGALPPHHDHCYVCGPVNPASTGVEFVVDGDRVRGRVRLDERHQGVPGLAHGGVLAALMDEAAGSLLLARGLRFVTAQLSVSYVAPVVIGDELEIIAQPGLIEGRKHEVDVQLLGGDETLLVQAVALFVVVSAEHFVSRGVSTRMLEAMGMRGQ